jgi:hypothetical protein
MADEDILVKILLFLLAPIFTIWALNTLFPLEIPVNFWTWLSALWLLEVVKTWGKNG